MLNLTRDRILSVYSGRPGCCCGCRGKHYYPAAKTEAGGKSRGYPVGPEEVSDRQVTRIFNLLQARASEVEVIESSLSQGRIFSLEDSTTSTGRLFIIYEEADHA